MTFDISIDGGIIAR